MVSALIFCIRDSPPLTGFLLVSARSGRIQLPVFVALLLLALPLVFTFRNCVSELAERSHQLTAADIRAAPYFIVS